MGQLPPDQAAGVIAAAVGRIRLGQTRFDFVVEFWTIPWQLVRTVCLVIAQTVSLFPLTQFAWRIRFVVAAVAVAQAVTDGRIAAGMVLALFIALTHLAPRWQRQWDTRSQHDSDRFVAEHGLGDALGRFLRRCPPEPRTLERIYRLTGPVVRPALLWRSATRRQGEEMKRPRCPRVLTRNTSVLTVMKQGVAATKTVN